MDLKNAAILLAEVDSTSCFNHLIFYASNTIVFRTFYSWFNCSTYIHQLEISYDIIIMFFFYLEHNPISVAWAIKYV